MTKTIASTLPLLAASLAFGNAPAHATSFIGDQMKASWRLPTETSLFAFNMSPSAIFTVGNGVEGEAQLSAISFLVDFTDTALTFTFLSTANFAASTFNGIYFEQLNGGLFGEIDAVSGLAASRIHNMGTALSVNFAAQRYAIGDVVTVTFAPDVPEPTSWAMMICGLALVGASMRRRLIDVQFA